MIQQETIVRILLESEIGVIESDGTRSMVGNINRSQYHDVADKILKLVDQPDVIKSVCEHCGFQPIIKIDDEYQCEICGNTQK